MILSAKCLEIAMFWAEIGMIIVTIAAIIFALFKEQLSFRFSKRQEYGRAASNGPNWNENAHINGFRLTIVNKNNYPIQITKIEVFAKSKQAYPFYHFYKKTIEPMSEASITLNLESIETIYAPKQYKSCLYEKLEITVFTTFRKIKFKLNSYDNMFRYCESRDGKAYDFRFEKDELIQI